MSKPVTPFNPARFNDQIDEALYARNWGPGARLKNERKELVNRLRKKAKNDPASLALADKLESCKPNTRCKSAACPECSHAAAQLVTEVAQRFLKEQLSAGTIVCVSIVPADGASKPGKLSQDQHARNVRRWKEALGRAGVTWFIGGSDWSLQRARRGPLPRPLVPSLLRVYSHERPGKSSRRRCSGSSRRPTSSRGRRSRFLGQLSVSNLSSR